MNNIKSDQDGFLLPKKEADQIQTILDNTETLLARQAPHRRAVTVSIKQPKPPVQNKPQPVAVVRAPEPPREKPNVRPTPMQRRAEKDRAAAAREQRRQTRILESIAENRGSKKGGGLLSGLGMGAGVLKGLMRAPANFAKGAARRGTDGRFMPAGKGRGLPRLGGLIKGMGKGGALAVVGGLFGGLQIEQSGMSRPDKNKAHAKNLVGVGGGLAGAAAGAKLGALAGSVVPGAGTVLGGLLGGALGALAGTQLADYATDRLDKAIDPQLSRNMFSSWRGFTNGAAGLWNSFTANTNARWKSFSETAQAGWNDFSGSLKTASLHVWQEMLPKKFTDYFADLGSWGKSAWGKFSEQSASYWDSVKSFAQSAWQGLREMAAPYVEQVKTHAQPAIDKFNDFIGPVIDKAKYAAGVAKDKAGAAWESAKQSDVGQAVGNAVEQGKAKVQQWGNSAKNAALSFLGYDMTKKYDHLGYFMNTPKWRKKFAGRIPKGLGKDINDGFIDCSGWSFHVTKMEMESLNQMLGFEKYKIKGNQAGMFNVGMHSAATQIGLASHQHGVVTDSRTGFDRSKLQAGMMIGQMKKGSGYGGNAVDVKGYGKTAYNHIVKVVRGKDGKLYISESQSGGGVTLTELDKWLNMRLKRGDTLTAVNPFGSDIGLLNGNIGDVVVNEAKKAGKRMMEAVTPQQAQTHSLTKMSASSLRYSGRNVHNQRLVAQMAEQAGFNPAAFMAMAHVETGGQFNEKAFNKGSRASGMFQFLPSNFSHYGLGGGKAFDARENTRAAIQMTRENRAQFMRKYRREPTIGELYLMHQQGWGGFQKLMDNKGKNAVSARGSGPILQNGGNRSMSAGEFMQMWENKVHRLYQNYSGLSAQGVTLTGHSPLSVAKAPPKVKAAPAPKPPVPAQPIIIKPAAAPKQNTANVPAIIASGGRLAHLPLSRNVENQNIAWLASGGIMSKQ